MNLNIERLYGIASKSERLIIGLMSGTSFDGLDVAVCKIKGSGPETEVELLQFETSSYENDFKEELKTIFSRRDADLEKVCLLNEWVAIQHATIINDCLQKWGYSKNDIDLIASHGQTIYHAPKFLHGREKFPNATLQIGDGDHIAVETGIITISDFRQKHIAAGGEGAPLALYGDYCLFSKKGENRVLLNMGGIANFTFLPASLDVTKVMVTDTGPGNTLLDAYTQLFFEKDFDKDAVLASSGTINEALLNALKKNSFFSGAFPKTTGPELFSKSYVELAQENSATSEISPYDVLATL